MKVYLNTCSIHCEVIPCMLNCFWDIWWRLNLDIILLSCTKINLPITYCKLLMSNLSSKGQCLQVQAEVEKWGCSCHLRLSHNAQCCFMVVCLEKLQLYRWSLWTNLFVRFMYFLQRVRESYKRDVQPNIATNNTIRLLLCTTVVILSFAFLLF
jgi:hypothetical protein